MKRIMAIAGIIFLLLALGVCGSLRESKQTEEPVIDAAHNSKNSLNWEGVYRGVIPGADSPGIMVMIALHYDGTYEIRYQYMDRGDELFMFTGTFKWDETGGIILLDTDELPPYYRVGEDKLIQLDMEGNAITGELADHYVLTKVYPDDRVSESLEDSTNP